MIFNAFTCNKYIKYQGNSWLIPSSNSIFLPGIKSTHIWNGISIISTQLYIVQFFIEYNIDYLLVVNFKILTKDIVGGFVPHKSIIFIEKQIKQKAHYLLTGTRNYTNYFKLPFLVYSLH